MIKLNVPFEEKDQAKALGALWNKEGKFWFIPSHLDFQPFSKWIDDETWEHLVAPVELKFNEIFPHITNQINLPFTYYCLEADVHNVYDSPKTQTKIIELIDNHQINNSLKAVITADKVQDIDLENKRIKLIGKLDIYKPFGQFQLLVEDFIVLGECSRITKINQWEQEATNYLENTTSSQTFEFNFSKLLKIGVITAKNSDALKDFKLKLNDYVLQDVEQLIIKEIELTKADLIVNALQELEQAQCDVICLLRGGGDIELLLAFSHPYLLQALYQSKTPIITGVGHKGYHLLCKRVKGTHNADTPTGAAEYLNRLAKSYFDKERQEKNKAYRKTKDEEIKLQIEELSELNEQLIAQNKKLQNEKSQLQQINLQQTYQLEKMQQEIISLKTALKAVNEKKGFLRRLLG